MRNIQKTMLASTFLGMLVVSSISSAEEFTGNIGIYSKYVLRGLTTPASESDRAVLQGGLDYGHDSGFYAGWWASSLDYTYSADDSSTTGNGFENDFYLGFAGALGETASYDLGLIQYYYLDVDDSNLTEFKFGLGAGPISAEMYYLLNDGWWGNKGDAYFSVGYETELPKNFTFSATAGFYRYEDADNNKLCAPDPAGCGITTKKSGFRHVDLSLSHPIGNTGADVSFRYVIGGKNRSDVDQDNTMVLGISYNFDL
jgi:uncharacterized protein (TIGR02001 family)